MTRIPSGALALVLTMAGAAASIAQTAPPPSAVPPRPPPAATPTPAAKPAPKPTPIPVLTGTVRGPDGKPIAGGTVVYRPLAAPGREFAATTKTDAEGRFRAELKTGGPVYVRVTAKGLAARTFEKAPPGVPLAVVLDRGQAIEGTVRDLAGQPLEAVRVVAVPTVGATTMSPWDAETQTIEARTDARGHFRLDGVAPGLHSVTAVARGFGSARKSEVRPGATVNLIARPGGWLAGRVTDPPALRTTSTGSSPGIIFLSLTSANPLAFTFTLVRPGRSPARTKEPSGPERASLKTPPRVMSKLPVVISASAMGKPALVRTRPRMATPCSRTMSPTSTTGSRPETSASIRRPEKRGATAPSA